MFILKSLLVISVTVLAYQFHVLHYTPKASLSWLYLLGDGTHNCR
jgi:hypothetical protein